MLVKLPAKLLMNHCFKYIILYLTMVTFVLTTFNKSIILCNFYLNQRAIAKEFCVNKDKPAMHCNGHCYLKKQLENEHQQEQALADAFGKNEVIFSQHHAPKLPAVSCRAARFSNANLASKNTSLYQRFIDKRLLKPPIFI